MNVICKDKYIIKLEDDERQECERWVRVMGVG